MKVDESAGERALKSMIRRGRAVEILRLLAEGLSDKQMASRLGVSPGGLKRRVAAAYRLAGDARTRHGAVGNAYRMGLIEIPDENGRERKPEIESRRRVERVKAELKRLAEEVDVRADGHRTRAYRRVAIELLKELETRNR